MRKNRTIDRTNPKRPPIVIVPLQAVVVFVLLLAGMGCTDATIELGEAVYPPDRVRTECAPGTAGGLAGITNGESTANGIRYNVRTPANYNPTLAHPLLMVYAPAARSRDGSERFTGLTRRATAAGFVVVYADHRRLSKRVIEELGTIPGLVANKWCIDKRQVFLTGHSDGGAVAMGLAFLPETRAIPAAIAPSAAGINGSDLSAYSCPDPIPVMVMHSADDTRFPAYGAEAAAWWAACNRCDATPGEPMANGCVAYPNCAAGGKTWYCEGTGPHSARPRLNSAVIEFFSSSAIRKQQPVAR